MSMLARALAEATGDPVLSGASELEPYASTFGGLVVAPPAAVVVARSAETVAAVLEVARRLEVPVTLRGRGHACGSHALAPGGVVITRDGGEPLRWLDGDRVELPASRTWFELETELRRRGRTFPVRTSEGGTTAGGTLAMGGFGLASISRGAQVDHVEHMRLVLADGTIGWHEARAPLGRLTLSGVGQLAVIDRVIARTEPWRPFVVAAGATSRSLERVLDALASGPLPEEAAIELRDGRWVLLRLRRQDTLGGDGGPGVPEEDLLVPPAPPDPGVAHLWNDYCVGPDGAGSFARTLERAIAGADHLERVHVLPLAGPPALDRCGPFEARTWPLGQVGYGFGVYATVPRGELGAIARVRGLHRALLDACLALGGRPYAPGTHALSEPERAQIYGAAWRELREVRAALDPLGLLNRFALRPRSDPSPAELA